MERTDVFIRHYDRTNLLRGAMSDLCHERWRLQGDARVHTLTPLSEAGCRTFHMDAKRWAEERSTTPIYIVADDDCLILGEDFVREGLKAMWAIPAFGILTAASEIEDSREID